MYTLTTMVEFSSAHTLVGHSGPCKKMHGHNWKVEVEITGENWIRLGWWSILKKSGKPLIWL